MPIKGLAEVKVEERAEWFGLSVHLEIWHYEANIMFKSNCRDVFEEEFVMC